VPRLRPVSRLAELDELTAAQQGTVSRRQALDHGMTDKQVRRALAAGDWRPSGLPGSYLTFSGPVPYTSRCWAALLYAGLGAVLSHETAAWIWQLRDDAPPEVHVTVPVTRRVRPQPGLRVHYALHLATTRHPAKVPPMVRVEDTVLDLVDRLTTTDAQIIDLVLRACQRRLTTTARLAEALDARKKIRRRALVSDLIAEAAIGVASALELGYHRDVEVAHDLPTGHRNRPEGRLGRRRYRDIRYVEFRLVVELDGRAAHPADRRELDDLRDNEVLLDEDTRTLRYGWRSVTLQPCTTAGQVAQLLRSGGWTGTPRRCGPGCRLPFQ
jgi:hypothetical protein